MIYDVIIIGAGASGLFLAANLKNKKVLIIEKEKIKGKKLLMSGGSKCNFTNNINIKDFIPKYNNPSFVRPILYKFNNKMLIEWFNKRGLKHTIIKDKVFTKDFDSKSLLNTLLKEIKAEILLNTVCRHIDTEEKIIKVNNKYKTKNLVIASGGLSYTTNDPLYENLNYEKTKRVPSLTPLHIDDKDFYSLSGISLNAKIKSLEGSILFAKKYLTGPLILDISSKIKEKDNIYIDFLPNITEEKLNIELQKSSKKNIINFLSFTNLPLNFLSLILKKSKVDEKTKKEELSRDKIQNIIKNLKNYKFKIIKKEGFDKAIVTKGGINTSIIDNKTMALKADKRIYFIGEVLDIDAFTGGFNLQFAFSSAYLCSRNLSI